MAARDLVSRRLEQGSFIAGYCLCLPLAAGGCAELIGLDDATYSGGAPDASTAVNVPPHACPLSDEFDDPQTQQCWKRFREDDVTMDWAGEGGTLAIVPVPGSAWFGAGAGFFMYREIEGNFVAETRVLASSRYNADQPSSRAWAGGGLLAHVPTTMLGLDPTYYGVGVGTLEQRTGVKAEVTLRRATTQTFGPEGFSALLRLCRVDPWVVALMAEPDIGEWSTIQSFDQSIPLEAVTLPSQVLLGLIAYHYSERAQDLLATFSYFHVKRGLTDVAECSQPLTPPLD